MSTASWRIAAERPPVFRGVPPLLVADVEFDNRGNERVNPKSLAARLDGDERDYLIRVPGRVPPKGKARLRAHWIVDRTMAPGTYHASVHTEGGRQPVELRVFERRLVVAIPRTVSFHGGSGDAVEAVLFLENRGNIDCVVEPNGLVFFEEVDWLGRALVFALRETGPDQGHHKYLDHVLHELRSSMVHKTTVKVAAGVETLAPGDSVEARMSMTLPEGLHKGRHYAAFLDLPGTRLRLELDCTGSAVSKVRRPR